MKPFGAQVCSLAALILLAGAAAAHAATFFDDTFNRGNGSVGNGWSATSGNDGSLVIQDDALTASNAGGQAGIYRAVDYSSPVTVSATVTQLSGFGGLQDRFDTEFLFRNDGTTTGGYVIAFTRGDQDFSDSTVSLIYNGATIASVPAPFQFNGEITPTVTLGPNGNISGTVVGSGDSFSFSFNTAGLGASGTDFAVVQGFADPRSASVTNPTIDNLVITTGAPSAAAVADVVDGAVSVTTSGNTISASFSPNGALTLAQAAKSLGYAGFNWQQQITAFPAPVPFTSSLTPDVPLAFPSSDPVPGGFNYQPGYAAYPFYYDEAPQADYLSSYVGSHEGSGQSLTFSDDPGDPCLGVRGLTYAACGGELAPAGSAVYFSTYLVGVNADGSPGARLFEFDWKSNFDGTFGGTAELNGDTPPDPGGTGGVTLLSERFLDPVPEPATWVLMVGGLGLLGAMIRRGRRFITPTGR